MVWRKSAWGKPGDEHRSAHEARHVAEREARAPVWMEPDTALDERETEALYEGVLSELPTRCRAVFAFIRDERRSYREAAARFGISVGLVVADVQRAERHLAARLLDTRIQKETAFRALRTARKRRRTPSARRVTTAS